MSSHHPPALDLGASLPHPDSYVQDLLRELSTALEAFKRERRGHDALAAVTKAFKRAASVMNRCAPRPGEHEFIAGERVIFCNLRQRGDLNGCLAIVKSKANVVDGDGRVEVSVGVGKKKEMIRVKPANLRLDWQVAADLHVTVPKSRVLVRCLESALRDQVCEVVCSDPATSQVTLRAPDSDAGGTAGGTVDVSVSSLVPATYIDIAREVHECALKIVSQAAGVAATPAVKAIISAVYHCTHFYIRCFRGSDASRMCVSFLNTLHVGGQSVSTPSSRQPDYYERLDWISDFLDICLHHIDDELQVNGWYDDACSLLKECKDVISSTQGDTSYSFFVLLNNLASLHMTQHRLDDAEAIYKEIILMEPNFHPLADRKEMDYMIKAYDVSIAAAMSNLATLHIQQRRFADAEALYRKALQMQQAKLGVESLDVSDTLHNLAVLLDKQEKLEEAVAMHQESIRIRELIQGNESLDIASNLLCLAMVYLKQKRVVEAEAMLKKALGIQQLKLGADTLDTSMTDTMNNLAVLYIDQRRYSDAEELFTQALRIIKIKCGPESLNTAGMISSLASVLVKVDRLEESEALYKEAVRIKEKLFGRESVETAHEICNLAIVIWRCSSERWSEVEDLHKEGLRIRESKLGRNTLHVAASLKYLGTLYMNLGRMEEAESMFQESMQIKERLLGHNHKEVIKLRNRLAELNPPPLSDI